MQTKIPVKQELGAHTWGTGDSTRHRSKGWCARHRCGRPIQSSMRGREASGLPPNSAFITGPPRRSLSARMTRVGVNPAEPGTAVTVSPPASAQGERILNSGQRTKSRRKARNGERLLVTQSFSPLDQAASPLWGRTFLLHALRDSESHATGFPSVTAPWEALRGSPCGPASLLLVSPGNQVPHLPVVPRLFPGTP